MALFKRVCVRLVWLQVAAVGIKYGWHLTSLLEDRRPPLYADVMVGFQLFALVIFSLAKPNKAKESALLLKIYASLLLFSVGQHVLTAYSYHAMWPKEDHYPRVIGRYAAKKYDMDYIDTMKNAEIVESLVDVLLFGALAAPAFLMNRYIAMAMEIEKMRTSAPEVAKRRAVEAKELDREAEHAKALARAKELEKEMARINATRKRK